MLDLGGTITCKIYHSGHTSSYYLYIKAETLGIAPGEVFLKNDEYKYQPTNIQASPWYIRVFITYPLTKNIHKLRIRKNINRLPRRAVERGAYYNEVVRISEEQEKKCFRQEIRADIILPLLKEKSRISNSLIYLDDYWFC